MLKHDVTLIFTPFASSMIDQSCRSGKVNVITNSKDEQFYMLSTVMSKEFFYLYPFLRFITEVFGVIGSNKHEVKANSKYVQSSKVDHSKPKIGCSSSITKVTFK